MKRDTNIRGLMPPDCVLLNLICDAHFAQNIAQVRAAQFRRIGDEPFEFTIGEKNMLPGFENAVIGMQKGDTKTITLPPDEAYGFYKKELVSVMERSDFPKDIHLEVGKRLRVRTQDGRFTIVTIKDFTEDRIVFDGNDPLASKTLTFKIELVEIL